MGFTRELSAVEGLRPDEIDALLSNPPGQSGLATSEPLRRSRGVCRPRGALHDAGRSRDRIDTPSP